MLLLYPYNYDLIKYKCIAFGCCRGLTLIEAQLKVEKKVQSIDI